LETLVDDDNEETEPEFIDLQIPVGDIQEAMASVEIRDDQALDSNADDLKMMDRFPKSVSLYEASILY
jgi:hypothetical protein